MLHKFKYMLFNLGNIRYNKLYLCHNYMEVTIMKCQMENQYGTILVDENVIATYAGSVAVECFGIVGMAAVNVKDGLVKLLKKEHITHGIEVDVVDNKITIDFHVIIAYGVGIMTVSDNLIETVKYKVEQFTGMKIDKINIHVEGVRVID